MPETESQAEGGAAQAAFCSPRKEAAMEDPLSVAGLMDSSLSFDSFIFFFLLSLPPALCSWSQPRHGGGFPKDPEKWAGEVAARCPSRLIGC